MSLFMGSGVSGYQVIGIAGYRVSTCLLAFVHTSPFAMIYTLYIIDYQLWTMD